MVVAVVFSSFLLPVALSKDRKKMAEYVVESEFVSCLLNMKVSDEGWVKVSLKHRRQYK